MSDTCIVCLGDLENGNSLPKLSAEAIKSEDADHETNVPVSLSTTPQKANGLEIELIAHLLPCGHDLHDECLKPWVERANSCPICRQSFNRVELSKSIGGTFIV